MEWTELLGIAVPILFILSMVGFLLYQMLLFRRRGSARTLDDVSAIVDGKQLYTCRRHLGPIEMGTFNDLLARLDLYIINAGYEARVRNEVSLCYGKKEELSEAASIMLFLTNLLAALVYHRVNKDGNVLLVRFFVRTHDIELEINAQGGIMPELISVVDETVARSGPFHGN